MRYVAAFAVFLSLAGCSGDVVNGTYPTLADARRDELFGRGWLPDVLPPSASDIRTTNNLDLNLSDGEFSFHPAEARLLFAKLRAGAPGRGLSPSQDELADKYRRRGYSVWFYEAEDGHWLFFCHASEGHCKYTMWFTGHTPNNSSKPTPLRGAA